MTEVYSRNAYRAALDGIDCDSTLSSDVRTRAMTALQRRAMLHADGLDDAACRFDLTLSEFVAYQLVGVPAVEANRKAHRVQGSMSC